MGRGDTREPRTTEGPRSGGATGGGCGAGAWRELRWLAAACTLLALGCSSYRTLDYDGGPVPLHGNEGILVLHLDTDVYIERLRVSGYAVGGPFEPGVHTWLVAARIGTHRFSGFELNDRGWGSRWVFPGLRDELTFEVRPGRVSYPGLLEIRLGGRSSARIVNRSASVLPELAEKYGDLLARYPVRYTGRGKDRFFEELEELCATAAVAGPAASEEAP